MVSSGLDVKISKAVRHYQPIIEKIMKIKFITKIDLKGLTSRSYLKQNLVIISLNEVFDMIHSGYDFDEIIKLILIHEGLHLTGMVHNEASRKKLGYYSDFKRDRYSAALMKEIFKEENPRRIKATLANRYKLSYVGEKALKEHLLKIKNANDIQWNCPIDYVDTEAKIAYEVKTFSKEAKDIKVKTNPLIKSRKIQWAEQNGYQLKTVVVIYDKRNKTTEGYIKDGYGGYRPTNMTRLW